MAFGISFSGIPSGLQCCRCIIEVFGNGTDVFVLQFGYLANLTWLPLPEEHILETVIAENTRVGSLDEVVEVGHGIGIAQHVGQVVGGHWPCVGVRVDGIDIGGAEEECL